jgi:hypothetical protein
MSLTIEQIDELFERSKNDRAIIVGSEIRQLAGALKDALIENEQLKKELSLKDND